MKTRTDDAEKRANRIGKKILKRLGKMAVRLQAIADSVRELESAVAGMIGRLSVAVIVGAWMAVLAAFTGCDSTDGEFHTPITGMSIEKAYRIAGEAGYMRQETKLGGRWMHVVQLEQLGLGPKALMELNGAPLLDAQLKQSAIFESLGRTDQQMIRAYNAAGVTWAKVGDGAIATAVMSGIVAGVMALNDDSGGGGSSKDSDKGGQQATGTTINQINNSPGASINNDGGEGGQTGGGSGGTTQAAQ